MCGPEQSLTIARYFDGRLGAAAAAEVEAHLPGCADCAAELAQLRALSAALRSAPLPRASAEFVARLQDLAQEVPELSIMPFVRRLTAMAAAILVFASVHWSLHRLPTAPGTRVTAVPIALHDELAPEERVIVDPEYAVATTESTSSASAAEAQLDYISQNLSGGRP